MPQGLPHKLRRVFIVQAVLAVFAVVVVLYGSGSLARDWMTAERIRAEARAFWDGRANDPAHPVPGTATVHAWFVPASGGGSRAVPDSYASLAPGLHDLRIAGVRQRLLIDERRDGRLYITMSFALVDRVATWTLFIAVLLASLAIAAVSWLSYRIARQMVLPVTQMAGEVARWDPRAPDLDAIDPGQLTGEAGREVRLLGDALRGLTERTQAFMRRERDFTREASHELRTPLAVVRVAADMLRGDPETPPRMQRSLNRIQLAAREMEGVLDAFLILAREDVPGPDEEFELLPMVSLAVEGAREMLTDKPGVVMSLHEEAAPRLRGSSRAMAVMVGNLLRNACFFTESGRIDVVVRRNRLEITDTGIGMDDEVLERVFEPFYRADQYVGGKGMGLAIARQLSERAGWPMRIDSVAGQGTTVTIEFAAARAKH
ncbi:HAMP domain-containing sensor histidine kinase [Luteimonas sp. MC1572]|uniref:sensor histidine kinase n=1 Tax=Luteimonas sp. MC1572 TaxID=2799325 RepID=UPI0018F0C80C|nr:HAMP domain-containing sensor histidine kinase [Luteimonas sp. MC1572]MBJ6981290.1 HAMP domain-containing histidine kinase [Luteimonas sp. MC1572]QQO02612.1 HAMP domain-containing histidine kinase [Luteimonas sp. MC1572]